MTLYVATRHVCQFDQSRYQNENCTPASGASGAAAVTNGKVSKSGGQMRSLVARTEEVNPATPGWHLRDLDLALSRLGVGFVPRIGDGWDAVVAAHESDHYIVLQGDSDQFGNDTCSGVFNGLHAVGVSPEEDEQGRWLIDDPICRVSRYEGAAFLKRYAEKLHPDIFFGVFTAKVPKAAPHMHSRYGGRRTSPFPDRMRADERVVAVRKRPEATAAVDVYLDRDEVFTAQQSTAKGLDGSGRWFGNHDGDRWVRSSHMRRQGGST